MEQDAKNTDRFFSNKQLYMRLGLLLLFVIGMFLLYRKLMTDVVSK